MFIMTETQELKAQLAELKHENAKLKQDYKFAVDAATNQELKCVKARNEIADLKKQIRYLSGQIESFKYCISRFCGCEK